jgi:hypothetical protein
VGAISKQGNRFVSMLLVKAVHNVTRLEQGFRKATILHAWGRLQEAVELLKRALLDDMAGRDCICFPPDESPALVLQAEIEAARAVLCPLHAETYGNAPQPSIAPHTLSGRHISNQNCGWPGGHSDGRFTVTPAQKS